MSTQIAVRLPDEMTVELDAFVASSGLDSRATVVRVALQELFERERRRRIGASIADGYRRIPQSEDELRAATASAIESINEEPW